MQTIVLDAGHGGTEPAGGSSPNHATGPNGLLEKDLTLDIARRVRRLMGDGQVILTRDDAHNRSLSERAATARLNHAALFLSLHWNGSPDATADGTETWIARRASARSRRLAQLLGRRVSIIAGAPNRGVRERDLGVLLPDRHAPETGACLIEMAFLSNPSQARRLESEDYRDELARGLVESIREALEERGAAMALDTDLLSSPEGSSLQEIADGTQGVVPEDIRKAILVKGESDANDLANRVFWTKHTDLTGKQLDPKDRKQQDLRKEWADIRRRQVTPLIWLRQLVGLIDKYRGAIPRELLLGWIALESDGRFTEVSQLDERGYFQIMWQGGEAKQELNLTEQDFQKLSADADFSMKTGVQLVEKYRKHMLANYPVADGSDVLWRLTKGRHAASAVLKKALDRLKKSGAKFTWDVISKELPNSMTGNIDRTFGYAARLKPFSDLVPAPAKKP